MTRDALPPAAAAGGRRAIGAAAARGWGAGPAFSVAFRDEVRHLGVEARG
jgi:hypothetical protein